MKDAVRFEDFGHSRGSAPEDPVELARSEGKGVGYEEGYSCGWEDALKSAEARRVEVSEELSRTVTDAGLTATDALSTARREAAQVLSAMVDVLFAPVAGEAALLAVTERLTDCLDRAMDRRPVVSAAPETLDRLKSLAGPAVADVDFVALDTLAEDQVVLEIGGVVDFFDPVGLLDDVRAALGSATGEAAA